MEALFVQQLLTSLHKYSIVIKKKILYLYKDKLEVPILGMVDNVINVNKCLNKTVVSNSIINTFIKTNELTLAHTKCSKMHIGKKCKKCPVLNVHEEQMKESQAETYVGHIISEDGKLDATIKARKAKAFSYLSEIRALLSDMPFGKQRLEVGLMLRNAMFVNGVVSKCPVPKSFMRKVVVIVAHDAASKFWIL